MTASFNPFAASRGFFRRALACCLLGLSAAGPFSGSTAHAQYADWNANPPKILPNERVGSGAVAFIGSGRQFQNSAAFAALKSDGSINAWGGSDNGSQGEPTDSGYVAIYSNQFAFAALKGNGSITAWGGGNYGDNLGGRGAPTDTGYTAIYSSSVAFAAMKADGSIKAWGRSGYGGDGAPLGSGYTTICSNQRAFAALNSNGSISAWGDPLFGGVGTPQGGGYTAIYSNFGAFAALKEDGSITVWGGDRSYFGQNIGGQGAPADGGYTAIYSTESAFAAMKDDGRITVWGALGTGSIEAPTDGGYTAIYFNQNAFAALKADGSITAFGGPSYGGSGAPTDGGYIAISSTQSAFAALKSDGSITAWGNLSFGGSGAPTDGGYTAIYSNQGAFVALKADGSITSWGFNSGGAPTSGEYSAIFSSWRAFAALKRDGSISAWGDSSWGGFGAPTGTGFRSIQSVSYYNLGAVVTAANSGITSSTASVSGEVVTEGLSPVTERGFIHALASVADPKIGDAGVMQVIDAGSGPGIFSTVLSGLTPNTAYILKSYVINEDGTTYSSSVNFSTNLPPVILSNGGNSSVALSLAENSNSVTTISASDEDADQTIGYSISGGVDAARFSIGVASGVLTFVKAPDYESPGDANADNIYEVIVKVTDNGNPPKSATQTLTITVTNLFDNGALAMEQPAGTALANGGSVNFGSHTIGQTTELTFTLISEGEADLRLPSGIAITGAAAADFSLIGSVPAVLNTGNSVTFSVRFTPTSSGARAASLSIPTNDMRPGRSPYVVSLTGTGTASAIVATYSNAANQVRGGWITETDFTIGTVVTHWPSAESPDKVVDGNAGTKFLALRNNSVGLILSPSNSGVAFNRLSFATANDVPERDPASYVIYGSSTVLTGASGAKLPLSGLTPLASGMIVLPDNRSTGPTVVQFANTTAYASYIVAFPTVRSTTNNTLTQISEVQLTQGINPPFAVAMAGARGGQLSGSTFSLGAIGSSNPGTNWNANESPDRALDGSADTKFLMLRNVGAGLIASPQAGPARVNRLSFWTANDSPERDPLTYQVYGFSDVVSQRGGTLNVATSSTLLGSGTLTLPASRLAGPVNVLFDNSAIYASYLVVFPAVKNSPSTTMTQISEVQFGYNGYPAFNLEIPRKLVAWGNNSVGQSSVPSGLSGVAAVSAGWGYSLALKSDGSVVGWGENRSGQATAPMGLFTAVVAGPQHALALRGNHTVAAWGVNDRGQATVPDGLVDIKAVAAGYRHSVALKNDGTVVAWGDNDWNQMLIPPGLTNIVAIAAGNFHSLVLKQDGTVASWGSNPAPVPAGLNGVTAIAAGRAHSMALKSDGSVVVWGDSGFGQTMVPSDLTGVIAIAAGTNHCLALKNDGSVIAWGDNQSQQSSIAAGLAEVISISAGYDHSLALRVAPVSVAEDSGGFSEGFFATGLTAGLGDAGQSVVFTVTNDNNALFSEQPAISAIGTLAFTPAADAYGAATVTVIATDSTGLSSEPETFRIEVTPVIDPPILALAPTSAAITTESATLGGEVTSSEAMVTERGVIYSLTANNAAPEIGATDVSKLSASGTLGVFTVESNSLLANTSYSFRSYAINSGGTRYSAVSTFTTAADSLLSPVDAWRQQHFGSIGSSGNAADLATPDGDGVPNLLKYALGLTPGQSGAGGLPKARITTHSGSRYLSLSFRRDPARSDVTILVEVQSSIGGTWTEIARSVNGGAFSGAAGVTETENSDGTKNVEIRDTQTIGSAARRFMRVRVER